MGTCELKSKKAKSNKATEVVKKTIPIKINTLTKAPEANEKNREIKECISKFSPFELLDPHISNVSKSICKIKIKIGAEEGKLGTGFLLKCKIDQECFYCLMSNEHVISKNIMLNKSLIYIYYDSEFKVANLKLVEKERYIKNFRDIGFDITVVEILDKDGISKDYFLYPEREITYDKLINSQIYIHNLLKGKN